ncbi:MAG: PAS domain-containing sensor histidine kinase [Rubrivivax sp.]|nr:MAG: PAS domain-containing sensor histidine kinase [Rubrivivax sp.]
MRAPDKPVPAARRVRPFTPRQWRLLALGCLLQAMVLLVDRFTPLGFSHGVLYALPIALGTVARRQRAIWVLTLLGVAGVVLGVFVSTGRLEGVTDTTIWSNRALGAVWVVMAGMVGGVVSRLLLLREDALETQAKNAALLEVSSLVGRLGGWQVELPGRQTHWSNEVFRLLGHPLGKAPELGSVYPMYVEGDGARVRAVFEACAADGTPFDEEVQLQGEGATRWLRVVGEAVRDGDGRILRVHGALQDIDGFKQTELALARSQAEWRLLSDSLPMMVWVADTAGGITYSNRYMLEYLASDEASLIGEGWLRFVHEDDKPAVVAAWLEALASGEPYEAEFRACRADGEWRRLFARAVLVQLPTGSRHWYGTAMDVQVLHDEREARAQLANRLVDTMESVGDAIVTLDHDWCFRYLNGHAELVLDRKREDLLGRNVWDAFPHARGTEYQAQYERCVRERVTVRFETHDPVLEKRFQITAYPVDDGLAVYFRDVTEERRLAEQLDQAQRMDSLGQLTGGVAHDFNNLLTVIMGNAEVLAEDPDANAQQREMAEMIASAANRGAELTQRLLTFARKQVLAPEAADINRLVARFTPLLKRALGEHVGVSLLPAADLWQGLVDAGRLEVALLNLAVNARDAMPDGGRLTIETANVWLDEDYEARHIDVKAGPYVMLAVSDTGHGMPQQLLARVFEPFFTTKGLGQGTGLGLAMVYGFAKQSRGHVSIYSEVGRGTTVRLYLPRTAADEASPRPLPTQAVPRSAQGELVLLVEDDEQVRVFACKQVVSLGYRVLEAANGAQALELLAAHPEVALLFTDVVMSGGMSGPQLAERARALRPGLPVLYTSGYTENAMAHHGRLEEGMLMLGKPYRRADLAEKLQQALRQRVGA